MNNYCCEKDNNNLALLVRFLKVISDTNRLKIVCFLRKEEKCVCEIWRFLDLPQNLISHHLKVLKDAGMLISRKDGLKVFYSINNNELKSNKELLNIILNGGEK